MAYSSTFSLFQLFFPRIWFHKQTGCVYDIKFCLKWNWKLSTGFKWVIFYFAQYLSELHICAGGQRWPASLFGWDRLKVNEYCCWCLLVFWATGKMEGNHLVPGSPFVTGKWIVRERSVKPHLCLDSSISLFLSPPHGQGALPNSCTGVCVWVCLISGCIANW